MKLQSSMSSRCQKRTAELMISILRASVSDPIKSETVLYHKWWHTLGIKAIAQCRQQKHKNWSRSPNYITTIQVLKDLKTYIQLIVNTLTRKQHCLPSGSENKCGLGLEGCAKTQHPKGTVSINIIHIYSDTAELQYFAQKGGNSIHLRAFKLKSLSHLTRIQCLDTPWKKWPDLFPHNYSALHSKGTTLAGAIEL